ncbi:MAG: Fe-S cluster assembly protein HesB [Chlorobiaceae bacterium]|nr:Fe-S cluster assembly protein HesB [Chlorobiaceae bacterium]
MKKAQSPNLFSSAELEYYRRPVLQKDADIELFRQKILGFYAEKRRSFPWRETTDRYAVMVSEIMLQQTQAERVAEKFMVWMERFPDTGTLSDASLRDVLTLWNGLGYNSRGQRLQSCAKVIMDRFGGVVPALPADLKTLPGIGDYTCRSIPVFADNLDVAAVDTNIRRIIIHEFALPEDTSRSKIQAAAEQLLPQGRSREWHNALMDYGALFLTSRNTGIRPLTKQSKFEGSKRWYRGRLLKDLVTVESVFLEEVEEKYGSCPWGLQEIIADLVREGLVEEVDSPNRTGGRVLRIRDR